jgi:exosortase
MAALIQTPSDVVDSLGEPRRAVGPGIWALAVGAAALAVPTLLSLNDQAWSQESGAHGPIVLATGIWLLWREKPVFATQARPGNSVATVVGLLIGIVIYLAGRISDLITLDAAGLYVCGLAIAFGTLGPGLMVRYWFPFLYFAFAIPPPALLLTELTLPLKAFVSEAATALLSGAGLPVAREGVTIFVAQYQLLVEDACSGMNSLVGLTAISLLYVYLRRGSSLAISLILIAFIIPVAIASNVVRIIILILLTYFMGDAAAQGILHPTAGLILFAAALFMIFGIDEVISRIISRMRRS